MYHYYTRHPSVSSSLPSPIPTEPGTKRRKLNSSAANPSLTVTTTGPPPPPSSLSSFSHSKIPSHPMSITDTTTITKIKTSIPTISLHSTTLRDITNQNGTPSTPGKQQHQIGATCYHHQPPPVGFGDRAVVELVKSRQRKIIKDINHFKRSVFELDKEIRKVQHESIPAIRTDIADGLSGVKLLEADISALGAELRAVELELRNLCEQMELTNRNVQLDYKIKLSEYESELYGVLESRRLELERELLQVDGMRPDEQFVNEMAVLNDELVEVGNHWASLSLKNKELCREYEAQSLVPDFEQFKTEREETLRKSRDSHQTMETRRSELKNEIDLKKIRIDRLTEEIDTLEEELQQMNQSITQGERRLTSLKRYYQLQTSKCISKLTEQASVESEYQKADSKYETQLAKLTVEQHQCWGLQLSINHILKRVTTVCYTCDPENDFPIDRQSLKTQFDNAISLSRNPLIDSPRKLLELEVQPFFEMQTRRGKFHYSLFYIDIAEIGNLGCNNNTGTTHFLEEFVDFCQEKYDVKSVSKAGAQDPLCTGPVGTITTITMTVKDSKDQTNVTTMARLRGNRTTTITQERLETQENPCITVTFVQVDHEEALQSLKDTVTAILGANHDGKFNFSNSNTELYTIQYRELLTQNKSMFIFRLPDSVETPQEQSSLDVAIELSRQLRLLTV